MTIYSKFNISKDAIEICREAELELRQRFDELTEIKEHNQYKVIHAMQKHKVSDVHFAGTTGYGYGDKGRDALDEVYADVFGAEDALVRSQIVSGTQAIALCMYGNLRPGDELLSVTGKPYDTLEEVIGIRGQGAGSLKEFGIAYAQVELDAGLQAIKEKIKGNTKMVLIQRSRGYAWREAISISKIHEIISFVKSVKDDIIVLVDNCYGEFVDYKEPTEVGADLIAGSLIKNPGGGLAATGGYIAGKREYVENAAYRLTTPGLGREVGASLGNNRLMYQGLFMAPHVVAESLKGAILCAEVMKRLGFEVSPMAGDPRGDIIQAIKFGDKEKLISFCRSIQKSSAVDSHVIPEPWDMPGYDCPVIMAAGAFIQGSSIELSADAPIKPPYIAYMQGGLVYEHVKLGVLIAVDEMIKAGVVANGGKG